jgi:hypothetical protein
MSLHLLATLATGVTMGLWFERIVTAARSTVLLGLGIGALSLCLLLGQEWAGIALGCLLGARLIPGQRSEG